MTLLEQIQHIIDSMDTTTWYRWVALYIGCMLVCAGGIIYIYYHSRHTWIDQSNYINEMRVQARNILKKAQGVYSQRAEVNKIIQAEPDFILPQYLQEVMSQTGITQSLNTINTTQIDREDQYRENIASISFTNTTMRVLTKFLQAIDQNKRLYTRELDITKSKKTPRTIDVNVVITTMQPRQRTPA